MGKLSPGLTSVDGAIDGNDCGGRRGLFNVGSGSGAPCVSRRLASLARRLIAVARALSFFPDVSMLGDLEVRRLGLKMKADCETGPSSFGINGSWPLLDAFGKEGVDFGFLYLYVKADWGGAGIVCPGRAPGAGSVAERKAKRFSVLGFVLVRTL